MAIVMLTGVAGIHNINRLPLSVIAEIILISKNYPSNE
jgi:hypothetical protein